MSRDSEERSERPAQERVAGVAFLIGVIAGLIVFALLIDDRIVTSWGDWIGQGVSMILGVGVAAACLLPILSSKPRFWTTLRHAANGILLIASVWGAAAAAAYWGSDRFSSAIWLLSLGAFGFLLHQLFAPDRKRGRWAGLYLVFFIVGLVAAVSEIMHWNSQVMGSDVRSVASLPEAACPQEGPAGARPKFGRSPIGSVGKRGRPAMRCHLKRE